MDEQNGVRTRQYARSVVVPMKFLHIVFVLQLPILCIAVQFLSRHSFVDFVVARKATFLLLLSKCSSRMRHIVNRNTMKIEILSLSRCAVPCILLSGH